MLKSLGWCVAGVLSAALLGAAAADESGTQPAKPEPPPFEHYKPLEHTTTGAVTVEGRRIEYQAIAGTLVVHAKGWEDLPQSEKNDPKNPPAEASMFYAAYFARGPQAGNRPITFVYNGGPGSASLWLHMGAFGPRRVVTADDKHTPGPPYRLANNDYSLLDASDLVFIDAPGAGFSRIQGKDKEKAFWGVDADADAFATFITEFLTKYGRWNSPRFLFGESYGTTRNAVLVNVLVTQRDTDMNGVMMLSQILAFDNSPDGPEGNPGIDQPYVLALPTYAATAWYHHRLPNPPASLDALLPQVEQFAIGDYAAALAAGSTLEPARKHEIAGKLHEYTGLPVQYIEKADLRVNGGEFTKSLQDNNDLTTGRLDTRYSGTTLDPLSKEAEYDPTVAGIASSFVSLFNEYVRKDLQFTPDYPVKLFADVDRTWEFKHKPPGAGQPITIAPNVMVDLAHAMKYDRHLKVQVNGGYFDLATPFYEGIFEMHHLPMPVALQGNVEYHYYPSGHMVYLHEDSLKELHDNAAQFIRANSAPGAGG